MIVSMLARWRCLALFGVALLAMSCGGGDGTPPMLQGTADCAAPAQKQWLRDYMQDWYYWRGASPDPAPDGFVTLADYFGALLYRGDDAGGPRDLWSYLQPTARYQQRFGAGQSLGYGLFVAAREGLPLKVRFVEPLSPAGQAGILRGDEILAVNGRSAADITAQGDFSALNAAQAGDELALDLATAGVSRQVTLGAQVFALTPVPVSTLLALPDGRQAGYLVLKDFIGQAQAPLQAALARFRAAGASELIIDLRDNGGGLVSAAAALASLVVGAAHAGDTFVQLRFNAPHRDADRAYALAAGPAPAFGRVVVITGARTCSASELLVNGLKPYAQVVTIGAATCGKPFGFVPVQSCENTVSAVNFESFNGAGQGRYYDGIEPTCPIVEDFERPLGDPAETLASASLAYLATGACPAGSNLDRDRAAALRARQRLPVDEPQQWQGMWLDEAPGLR